VITQLTGQWIFSIVAGTFIWQMTFGMFVRAFDAMIRKAGGQ
jgi:hypothetical protein